MTLDALRGAVLFTDLVGFTEFTDVVGDAGALEVLEVQAQLASAAIGSEDGRIVKELGDGLMLWFGRADSAIDTALRFRRSIEEARSAGTFPVALRMGIHHGEALPRGDDLVGHTINVGARIADLAGPGELLVSDVAIAATATERRTRLRTDHVGPVRVKGVEAPVWLQRVNEAKIRTA